MTMTMTEIEELKAKCLNKNGSPKKGAKPGDLTRLKLLQDGEPLSKSDVAAAKEREEERVAQDKADFKARQATKTQQLSRHDPTKVASMEEISAMEDLDPPAEHPRIVKLKAALLPFTKIEAHDSRPNEFVLFTRDISITAGMVRDARKAMKV